MTAPGELFRVVQLVGGHGRGGWAFVFVCYLDDSDAEQSSVITLAGYVAKIDAWLNYERHAQRVYDQYGVDVLEAKLFHKTDGCFKGWSRTKKLGFVDALYATAKTLTWGVGVSIGKAGFVGSKRHPAIGPNMSALGLAFASIMHGLIRGNPLSGLIQAQGLSFVVESGHRNNPDLERYFHSAKTHELFDGFARSITFGDKKSARALHLADFLAFHLRRHHAMELSHGSSLIIPKGRILHKITNKVPHLLKVNRATDLIRLDDPTAGDAVWASIPISAGPKRD